MSIFHTKQERLENEIKTLKKRERLHLWKLSNLKDIVNAMECRGDENCDHCLAIQVLKQRKDSE